MLQEKDLCTSTIVQGVCEGGEDVRMVYVEFYHPDYDQEPEPHLISSFRSDADVYLLWASPVFSASQEDFDYMYETLIGLLESISLE